MPINGSAVASGGAQPISTSRDVESIVLTAPETNAGPVRLGREGVTPATAIETLEPGAELRLGPPATRDLWVTGSGDVVHWVTHLKDSDGT